MNDDVQKLLDHLFGEFQCLLDPIIEAAQRPEWLYDLFTMMGWNLEEVFDTDLGALRNYFTDLRISFQSVADAANLPDQASALAQGVASARTAFSALETLTPLLTARPSFEWTLEAAKEFNADLVSLLGLLYLSRRWPTLYALGHILGLIREEQAGPINLPVDGDDVMLRMPIRRPVLPTRSILNAGSNAFRLITDGLVSEQTPNTLEEFIGQINARYQLQVEQALGKIGPEELEGLTLGFDVLGMKIEGSFLPNIGNGPITLPLPIAFFPELVASPSSWRVNRASNGEVHWLKAYRTRVAMRAVTAAKPTPIPVALLLVIS